ncbi:MAG: MFS transporter, partial [Longimicrobiales bacterium]|nr:MFS transporter [Longimicrobiales bacterium]
LLLTLVAFAAALALTEAAPGALVLAWASGLWGFLAFAMQMVLILVTGHAIASAPPVMRGVRRLVALPRTGAGAAALVVSAFTLGMAVAAVPAGRLTDRARPSRVIPAGVGVMAASIFGLWWAPVPIAAAAAMAIYAVGQTLVATSATATLARYFGRTHHGAIRSFAIRIGVIGTGLGPLVTGLSADRTGGYLASTLAFLAMCLPVALAGTTLRPPEGAGG